jgi:hypothetical protein
MANGLMVVNLKSYLITTSFLQSQAYSNNFIHLDRKGQPTAAPDSLRYNREIVMINKLVGIGFIFISAMLYIGHYAATAAYARTITGWGDSYKMQKALEVIGNDPQNVAFTALAVGIVFIVRGEIREYIDRNKKL